MIDIWFRNIITFILHIESDESFDAFSIKFNRKKTYKLKIHNNLPITFFIINCKGTNKKYPLEIHTDYSALATYIKVL